jgi:hypothetical protein
MSHALNKNIKLKFSPKGHSYQLKSESLRYEVILCLF